MRSGRRRIRRRYAFRARTLWDALRPPPYSAALRLWIADIVGCARGFVQPQALDRLAADEVLLDDLVDVLQGNPAVPDALGVDDHRAAPLAVVQAACLVGADVRAQPARFQCGLECL